MERRDRPDPAEDKARWERETVAPFVARTPERAGAFETMSGLPVERLYTEADLPGWDARERLGHPGEFLAGEREHLACLARRTSGVDAEAPGVGVLVGVRVDGVGEAAPLPDLLEQARGHPPTDRVVEYSEGEAPRVVAVQRRATEHEVRLLGVPAQLVAEHGVVSAACARAMAAGAAEVTGAGWGLATTGVAGPDTQEGHPAGTVFVGLHGPGERAEVRRLDLCGDRAEIRAGTVAAALALLQEVLLSANTGDARAR